MNKKFLFLVLLLFCGLLLTNCENKTNNPSPTTTVTAPTSLAYSPSTIEIAKGQSGTSTTPTVVGTAPFTYTLSVTPNVSGFSVASNGSVSIPNTLNDGTYTVTVTAKNSAGQTSGNLTVVVKTGTTPVNRTTFEQVRPILSAKCGSCHPEWQTYSTTRNKASVILQRIQLQPSQGGFMPQGGSRLPDSEIQTIQKWIADGLLEK